MAGRSFLFYFRVLRTPCRHCSCVGAVRPPPWCPPCLELLHSVNRVSSLLIHVTVLGLAKGYWEWLLCYLGGLDGKFVEVGATSCSCPFVKPCLSPEEHRFQCLTSPRTYYGYWQLENEPSSFVRSCGMTSLFIGGHDSILSMSADLSSFVPHSSSTNSMGNHRE